MQRAPLKRGSPACSAVFAHASAPAESLIRFALTWVKNAARQGGKILAGPLSGTLLLPPPHQSSQRQGCTDPGDERAVRKPPCEGSLREFFLFSSKAAFLPSFFFLFFFTLISLRDLIVSQVAHQVHSTGRLEKDAPCIDE